jgi:hypothetical protein
MTGDCKLINSQRSQNDPQKGDHGSGESLQPGGLLDILALSGYFKAIMPYIKVLRTK